MAAVCAIRSASSSLPWVLRRATGLAHVAVEDLDGNTLPDLVTENSTSNDLRVLINLPESTMAIGLIEAATLLRLLARRRSSV